MTAVEGLPEIGKVPVTGNRFTLPNALQRSQEGDQVVLDLTHALL